jgi:hypothetical protein
MSILAIRVQCATSPISFLNISASIMREYLLMLFHSQTAVMTKEGATMADERDTHRTGGQPDQPHGTVGPPTDRNPDETRHDSPGTKREAERSTNPTRPERKPETDAGAPG